jgi:MFS family permease
MSKQSVPSRSLLNRWSGIQSEIRAYPNQFWLLVSAAFIDRLGGAMLFPFLTLYLTKRFEIGMTQVGVIFGLYSIASVFGSVGGGAMTDRFGRKGMLIFGLVMSASSSVLLGLLNRIELVYPIVILVGALAESGGPAQQALVADLLPEEKRAEGYGIFRIVFNLAVAIGPLLGGLLASRSYLLLFLSDAFTSIVTAVLVYFTLRETWSPQETAEGEITIMSTIAGYRQVLRDSAFVWYMLASMLISIVYIQMNTSLPVYLRDNHGVNEQGFGYILSLNAGMVVLFQFFITRWVTRYRPLVIMAAGALVYSLGFAMYGVVSAYSLFLLAMAIITVGEMMVSPVGQAIVMRLSPEEMRGRYMAAYGFTWVLPAAVGPLLAGMVLDNLNPNWLWYAAGFVGVASASSFFVLEWRVGQSRLNVVDKRLRILERLEQGKITAENASRLLEELGESSWARLAQPEEPIAQRHLRFRISDLSSGMIKHDLRLPVGLVNTVIDAGGQLSPYLDRYDREHLTLMISRSSTQASPQHLDNGDEHLEVTLE